MVASRPRTGLSRKIAAYYLCFCLAAVCWVTAALLLTSHALLCDRTANSCLSRLGKASATVEMHWLRNGEAGLDALIAELRNECRAAYWTVVGVDGTFLAHTEPALKGQVAAEYPGTRTRMGDATGVRYATAAGNVQEYRVALTTGKGSIGELRVGVAEPNLGATIQAAAPYIPVAVVAPLALVAVGAVVLSRVTRPVTTVEARLREIASQPSSQAVEILPMRARDAASLGWNRVVEHLQRVERTAARGDVADVLDQAAQARTETQYEQILQRLSDGIAVTDAEGRIAFANRAISALLGNEDESAALTGAPLEARLLELVECPEDSELLSPAAQDRTTVCEMVQRGAESERVLRVARLPLGGDSTHGHVWSLRDVTQQKLAEQTRDRFIDTATHELRTPLSNIKAYAETLATAECIDVELQKEFCNIINSEVTRLARFIDDLLSISSMEVGALSIDRQKVETERLFAEVLSKVEPLLQQKQVEFESDLPPKLPELRLDKDKIVAVVVNVLGNAAKYTPIGGRVSLKVRVEDDQLRIAVQDTGVGISAEDLPRLFEKFFRSDDPRVQAETGTGLGLSLTREIVRMHGGEITVESELNKGSTFTVCLPLS